MRKEKKRMDLMYIYKQNLQDIVIHWLRRLRDMKGSKTTTMFLVLRSGNLDKFAIQSM